MGIALVGGGRMGIALVGGGAVVCIIWVVVPPRDPIYQASMHHNMDAIVRSQQKMIIATICEQLSMYAQLSGFLRVRDMEAPIQHMKQISLLDVW